MNRLLKQSPRLRKSYVRKVMKGLKNLRIALAKVHNNRSDRKAIIEIRGIADAISELAMIHGYHGVESIALKISTSFKPFRVKSDPNFLSKIELAIKGIQHVVAMEDGLERKLIIKKTIRGSKVSSSQISSLEGLSEKQRQMVELESDAKLVFDINESDYLNNIPGVLGQNNVKPISRQTQTAKIPS